MASIRPHPAVICGRCLGPEPPQQLTPVNRCFCRLLERPGESSRRIPGEPRKGLRLLDCYLPIARLFFGALPVASGLRLGSVEDLADASRSFWRLCLRVRRTWSTGIPLCSAGAEVRLFLTRRLLRFLFGLDEI